MCYKMDVENQIHTKKTPWEVIRRKIKREKEAKDWIVTIKSIKCPKDFYFWKLFASFIFNFIAGITILISLHLSCNLEGFTEYLSTMAGLMILYSILCGIFWIRG